MGSQLTLLLEYIRGAWLHRRLALGVAWVVFAILLVAIALMPSQYSAKAQFYVNSSTILQPLLEGVAVAADSQRQADIVKRSLLARPTLDSVARESGMYELARTPDARENVIAGLTKNITVDGSLQSRVYGITYSNRDPETARKVVQALLDTFVRGSSGADSADAKEAAGFFEVEVAEYAQRLDEAERKLAEFKKQNLGLMPDDRGDYFARLQQEMTALEKLQGDYLVAKRLQDALRSKITVGSADDGNGVLPSANQIQLATMLDAQIAQSSRELDQLLLRYTDKHPQVSALRETVERLEERRRKEAGNVRATGGGSTGSEKGGDTVVSSLQISLDNADLEVATLGAQVEQSRNRVAELKRLMSVRPEIEAELTRLNRDYGVTKERYETLLRRLESANTSHRVDETGRDRIQVIEEPRLAVRPSSPPRFLFTLVAMILAVSAGLFAALAASALKPVYLTRRSLEDGLGVPVVGVVAESMSASQSRSASRRVRLELLSVALLLAVATAAAISAQAVSVYIRSTLGVGQ